MLLLVLGSAVVFLSARNSELEGQTESLSGRSMEVEATRSQLESDVAVLESAYDAAAATRSASVDQIRSFEAELESVRQNQVEIESAQIAIEEVPEDITPRLLILAPKDGAVVRPLETVTIYLAAWAKSGVGHIDLSIDNGEVVSYPASGLLTFTLPVQWQVPSPGNYTINAVAYSLDEEPSQTETVNFSAGYLNDEDREVARVDRLIADLRSVRFPASVIESVPLGEDTLSPTLHLQLLTGWERRDDLSVSSTTSVLQVFDFIPPGYDLAEYIQSVDGDLAAYNAPGMNGLVAIDSAEENAALAQWIELHQLAHEIQVDSFHLAALDLTTLDSDARTALRALVEGDAVFMQNLFLQDDFLDQSGREGLIQGLEDMDSVVLDVFPLYLRNDFEFAYTSGLEFVLYLYSQGGFEALDAAWRNPPLSTEQILHPEKYLGNESPVRIYLPPLEAELESGWRFVDQDTFGEFILREYLAQTLDSEQTDVAASGWAGGQYALYMDEESKSRILLLRLSWDMPIDRDEFETAFQYFVDHRSGIEGIEQVGGGICWEQADVICLYQIAGDTLIIRAPDLDTSNNVRQIIITH
jgi:hypothetical protein